MSEKFKQKFPMVCWLLRRWRPSRRIDRRYDRKGHVERVSVTWHVLRGMSRPRQAMPQKEDFQDQPDVFTVALVKSTNLMHDQETERNSMRSIRSPREVILAFSLMCLPLTILHEAFLQASRSVVEH